MNPELCVTRTVLGAPLTARVQVVDGGVRAEVYGGTRPHIGAVSIAGAEGDITTTQFPTHRDGAVSARWAEVLAAAGLCPAVVLAGIHYDGLSPQGIRQVLDAADQLLQEVLTFAAGIVDIARNELPYVLSPNAVFTLADHINFAMERARKQLRVRMPLAYDVEQTSPREYRIGQYTVKRILKEFHIALPREEAAGIALNLLNAKLVPEDPAEQEQARDCAEMLEEITELVEQEFKIIIDRESFNYSRYATHLQYLFDRIRDHKEISSDNLQLYKSLREEFPDVAACVEKIADHIRQSWGSELSEEEKLYLILHVNRICIKEGL